jgi:hypothetical protein
MRDQRMAPPRRPGAPGRSKPACSAYAPTGIGSSRKATYHRSVTTRPAAATPGVIRSADAVSNRA